MAYTASRSRTAPFTIHITQVAAWNGETLIKACSVRCETAAASVAVLYVTITPIMLFDPTGLAGEARYVISQGSLNMRSGAGTGNAVIATLARGTTVIYTSNKTGMIDGHKWAEVTVNGKTGWVAATYLGTAPVSGQAISAVPKGNNDKILPVYYSNGMRVFTDKESAEKARATDELIDSVTKGYAIGGIKITGFTKHGLAQAIGRDGGLGVSNEAILDTIKNPTKIVEKANGTIQVIGENATVVLNKIGEVVTTWARTVLGRR